MGRKRLPDPERYCKACGARLKREMYGSRIEDMGAFVKRIYCDQKCMAKGMNRNRVSHASTSREKASKVRASSCEACGAQDVRLHVHHIDEDPFNNTPSNLSTLCVGCHRRSHSPNWTDDGATQRPCLYCAAPSVKQRLCNTHLSRRQRYGHPLAKKRKLGSEWVLMYELGGVWFSTLSVLAKTLESADSGGTATRLSPRSLRK